jgi:hypothetical protein
MSATDKGDQVTCPYCHSANVFDCGEVDDQGTRHYECDTCFMGFPYKNDGYSSATQRCSHGPDDCMDDLCRGSDVGLCGALSDRLLGIYEPDDGEPYEDDDA